MRRILIAATLALAPSLAAAASPDGPDGTIWIDLGASTIIDGRWEATRTLPTTVPDGNDITGKQLTGTVGVVICDRVTLRFGLGYVTTTAVQQFGKRPGDPTSGLDLTQTGYQFGGSVRVYLNLPD